MAYGYIRWIIFYQPWNTIPISSSVDKKTYQKSYTDRKIRFGRARGAVRMVTAGTSTYFLEWFTVDIMGGLTL